MLLGFNQTMSLHVTDSNMKQIVGRESTSPLVIKLYVKTPVLLDVKGGKINFGSDLRKIISELSLTSHVYKKTLTAILKLNLTILFLFRTQTMRMQK